MIFNGANKAKEVERKQELCTPERTEKDCSGFFEHKTTFANSVQGLEAKITAFSLVLPVCIYTLHSRKH